MSKKKKNKSPTAILAKAEELFEKKSYQAALLEYKKLDQDSIEESAAAHLKVCEQETAAARTGDLLKKARRMLKRDNLAQALSCFEQLKAVTGDSGLDVIIAELREKAGGRDMALCAAQAEADGEYLRAAAIFGKLYAASSDKALLCGQARCFLLAGQWQQAADAYAEAQSSLPVNLYNAGFALARQGKFCDCLRLWQGIESVHPDFLTQKKLIGALFIQEMNRCVDESPWEQEKSVRQQLDALSLSGCAVEGLPGGRELLARCDYLRLARLWQEGQMREILEMGSMAEFTNPSVLEIQAKAAYHVMVTEGSFVTPSELANFIDYWLSSLFHPVIVQRFSGKEKEAEWQDTLLNLGADIVRKYAEQHPKIGGQLVEQWQEDLALLRTMTGLSVVKKKENAMPVYTPALALQLGIADQLFSLIKSSQDEFTGSERWVAVGAAYSPAAASLLMVRSGEYKNALNGLVPLKKYGSDPFIAYGMAQVKMDCGIYYFQCGHYRDAEKIFAEIFHQIQLPSVLEKKLITVLGQKNEYNIDRLAASVNILTLLQQISSLDKVNKVLCSVMTNHVVQLKNEQKVSVKILAASMEKAVALNPEDAFAQMTLDDVRIDLEIIEMQQAIGRGKLSKAARIAGGSQYPQVVKQFFDFAYQVIEQVNLGDYPDKDSAFFMLRQLLKNVLQVDSSHKIVHEIKDALDELEQKPEV